MKKTHYLLALVFLTCGLLWAPGACAQEAEEKPESGKDDSGVAFSVGGDLVSRYIWRGADYGNSPAVQPSVALTAGGFKVGFWGSYGLGQYSKKINDSTVANMGHYAEVDFYLSYTLKGFTLTATDYFFPNGLNPNTDNKYYNFKNATTGHTVEVSLAWAGPEKFPLQLYAGTLVYGADKDKDSTGVYGTGSDNNFSTYFEAAYLFDVKGFGVKPFLGGIPFGSGWYGPYAGIINAGVTVSRAIPVSKSWSIPVYGSFITNPQAESVFLVFGITL